MFFNHSKWLCAAVIAVAAVSCNTKELQNDSQEEEFVRVKTTIMAEYGEDDTKTVLGDNGQVYWKPGEYIGVTFGRYIMDFVSYNLENATSAMFVGDALVSGGFNEGSTVMPGYTYWGIYPFSYGSFAGDDDDYDEEFDYKLGYDKNESGYYDDDPETDGKSVTTTLPNWQDAKEDSFDHTLFITLAKSDDYRKLSFYNVCGGVCFSVTEEGVKSVILRGNNDENLAGRVKLVMDENNRPKVKEFVSPRKEVTLVARNGGYFTPGKTYYIVTLPVELSKGYTLTFTKDDFVQTQKVSDTPVAVSRSTFSRLPEADRTLEYKKLPAPASNQILYLAAGNQVVNVERVCLEASIVSNEFKDGYGLITCDRPIESICYNAFYDCKTLTQVVLPASVKSIGEGAFERTEKLQKIDMPGVVNLGAGAFRGSGIREVELNNEITEIPSQCFFGCKYLTHIDLPDKLVAIREYAFAQTNYSSSVAAGLMEIVLPESLETLENGSFYGCGLLAKVNIPSKLKEWGSECFGYTAITSVEIPDNYTKIPEGAFETCSKLISVKFPVGLKSIGAHAFRETAIKDLVLPETVDTISYSAFYSCNMESVKLNNSLRYIGNEAFEHCHLLKEIVIPYSVVSIGYNCFEYCKSLEYVTFERSTPSSFFWEYNEQWDDYDYNRYYYYQDIFYGCPVLRAIYVPSNSVDIYKEHFYSYADLIVGLDTLATVKTFNVNGCTFSMIHVPGGSIRIGTNPIIMPSYYIAATETTRALWNAVMGTTLSDTEFPVAGISYVDITIFIKKLNEITGEKFTLPTLKEFVFAAHAAGMGRRAYMYSGSDYIDEVAWYADNSDGHVHPVARKNPNDLGLYDMTGNVNEFTREATTSNAIAIIGGSYTKKAEECEIGSYWLFGGNVNGTYGDLGFRLVMDGTDVLPEAQGENPNIDDMPIVNW